MSWLPSINSLEYGSGNVMEVDTNRKHRFTSSALRKKILRLFGGGKKGGKLEFVSLIGDLMVNILLLMPTIWWGHLLIRVNKVMPALVLKFLTRVQCCTCKGFGHFSAECSNQLVAFTYNKEVLIALVTKQKKKLLMLEAEQKGNKRILVVRMSIFSLCNRNKNMKRKIGGGTVFKRAVSKGLWTFIVALIYC